MAGDANFNNDSLLLHCDKVSTTTFVMDSSPRQKTVTLNGNAALSSTQSKFGSYSLAFDGSGDYASVWGDLGDFDFGTGDFTLALWARFTSLASDNPLLSHYDYNIYTAGVGWALKWTSTNNLRFFIGDTVIYDKAWTPSTNTWYHIAVCRSGTDLKFFIDGTQLGTTSTCVQSGTTVFPITLQIGRTHTTSESLSGYLDEILIKKGEALYTADFTAPSTAYLSAGQLSGNITESLDITDWRITATRCDNGQVAGTSTSSGSTYSVDCNTVTPCNVTIAPKVDYKWTAGKTTILEDYVVAVNPDGTPHIWKCTAAGTTGGSEPTWNLSSTTTDNTTTWAYVAPLVDPVTLGPKIPS